MPGTVTPPVYVRDMGVETRWVAVGGPAFDALVDVVTTAKDSDPLRPVTVVTPTPAAAVSLRRGLARRAGGVAVVGFQSLDALAEQIAAPRLGGMGIAPGTDRELVVAAVRSELGRAPGCFAAIAHHRSTWEALARAIDEVAGLDAGRRRHVAAAGGLAGDVVRLHDAVAERVAVGGRSTVLRAATEQVRADPASLHALGPVVVHLPGRLDVPATDLLREMGERSTLVVIGGLAGEESIDRAVAETVERIGGTPPTEAHRLDAAVATDIVTTNDVDDEIRVAVRALLTEAEAGHALHEMALVHPSGPPYARAVAEVLRAADIPYSGPSVETLGHTAAGRVILGLLDIAAHDFARQAVVDLWASGVVVGRDGHPMRGMVLDERSRRLGVLGGRADWRERLAGRRRWIDGHPSESTGDAEADTRRAGRRSAEIAELDELEASLDTIEALLDAVPVAWDGCADWASTVLDTLCGPLARRGDWPAHEAEADTAIRTVLGRLSALAGVEPDPVPAVVSDTIRASLDTPAPRRSTTGTGLMVTTLDHPPVVPLAAVVVVGLAEGHVPRAGHDDVLLSDEVRATARLPVAADVAGDQRRALQSALASASGLRLLTFARGDQRSGRTQVPSRWLIDAVEATTGHRPRTEQLIRGAHVDGVRVVASHGAAIADDHGTALHGDERRLAALASVGDFDAHPAALDPVVAAGAALTRGRAADAFTRFDGNLGGAGVDVLADDEHHLSPTSIETYATCPRRWFLGHALGVRAVDRPEEVDRLQPRDKGSLAHLVLERFIAGAIESGTVPEPDEPWGTAGDERLRAVAGEVFADFERSGLTGHPRWWAYDRDEIVHVLLQTLRHDDQIRAATRATPSAVELTFGRDGRPPLRITLDDGRVVPLAGQADRVDAVPGGVRVYDYKYASSGPYKGLDTPIEAGGDPVDGGRRLQLLAYAEAAAAQRGVDRSSAWYWFLKPGHTGSQIGYEIGPEHRRLLRETLRVLVDGVRNGYYPAHSGPHEWFVGTNANCGFCDFNRICPADREDEWERVRADPALAEVVRLAEEGAPAFLVTGASS